MLFRPHSLLLPAATLAWQYPAELSSLWPSWEVSALQRERGAVWNGLVAVFSRPRMRAEFTMARHFTSTAARHSDCIVFTSRSQEASVTHYFKCWAYKYIEEMLSWKVVHNINNCVCANHRLYKRDGQLVCSPKVKPKCFDRPLVLGCSIGHILFQLGWT